MAFLISSNVTINNKNYNKGITMSLISSENAIAKHNFLSLSRSLSLEDVTLKTRSGFPNNVGTQMTSVSQGVEVYLKQSIINEIIELSNIRMNEDFKFDTKGIFGQFCSSSHAFPSMYIEEVYEELRYGELNDLKSKNQLLTKTTADVKERWVNNRDSLTQNGINRIQADLEAYIERHNSLVKGGLYAAVVDFNVNPEIINETLSPKNKIALDSINSEITGYKEQIKKLQKIIISKESEAHNIKKISLETSILIKSGPITKAALNDLASKENSSEASI
jgi:hypothetical protein